MSTATTVFPVLAKRIRWLSIPRYVYLFARYFGSGVIVATAFVHLYVVNALALTSFSQSVSYPPPSRLDPAYSSIGPYTCVGMTPGAWSAYSWTPAILLTSCMAVFLVDVSCQEYVRQKYGFETATSVEEIIVAREITSGGAPHMRTQDEEVNCECNDDRNHYRKVTRAGDAVSVADSDELNRTAFRQQFMAFFIMEAGIILHSVFIGTACQSSLSSVVCCDADRPGRSQFWGGRRRVENPLSRPHLSSVFRGPRNRRPHVCHSFSKGLDKLASMGSVCGVWFNNPHRDCCWSRGQDNIQFRRNDCRE